jgi:hypothetical protein
VTSLTEFTPSRWPAIRGRVFSLAHLPFPSIMIAMCFGISLGSILVLLESDIFFGLKNINALNYNMSGKDKFLCKVIIEQRKLKYVPIIQTTNYSLL